MMHIRFVVPNSLDSKLNKEVDFLDRMAHIKARMADRRKGEVVFISHCILNTNARYLGGSERSGSVEELARGYLESGVGICQMPCPERRAWGGVLKPYLWLGLGLG